MKKTSVFWFAAALLHLGSAQAEDAFKSLRMEDSDEIGVTISSYSYNEPSVSVTITATNFGLVYAKTKTIGGNEFILSEIQYVNGSDNYSGSGTATVPKYYYDFKVGYGQSFSIDDYVLAPYIGVGYRYLDENGSGLTSTSAILYERQSTYVYIPVGVKRRDKLANGARLETTIEYDWLLYGTQMSGLSAANNYGYSYYPDVTNKQNSGYGLRLSAMYKDSQNWSYGPYWNYWSISDSNTATILYKKSSTYYSATLYEPANTTIEYGFKVMYKF
jgi:hypothetical protein